MIRTTALTLIAAALAWGIASAQEEAITIKMKTRAAGDVSVVTKKESVTTKLKVEDAKGNTVVDKNEVKSEVHEYKETIQEREGSKPPTKFERAYTKSQVKAGDEVEDLELKGKTVVFVLKGDKYTFKLKDGGDVSARAAETFTKELARKTETSNAELEKLMLPKKAVKPGETWKLDIEPVLANLFKNGEIEFHLKKAIGTGKLLKAYKKDGRLFGEIRYDIMVPLKAMGKVPTQMVFNDGAKLTMELKLDTCIDGTSDAGTMQARVAIVGNASTGDAVVHLDVTSLLNGTQTEPAKK